MANKEGNIYRTIVESIGQDIFISDGKGNIIFVNPASIEINTLDAQHVIGRNVSDLVKEGYFSESSTLKAIDEKKTVSVLMTNKTGKRFISTSTPVFDNNGDISLVISTSHDVEAMNSLFDQLDMQDAKIASLQHELSESADYISIDTNDTSIAAIVSKAASLDIPILITGEPGTGKHTAAREIHLHGSRKDMSLISVNCETTDPDLLDAELFGSETTTGKSKHITRGRLEFADGGSLILNDIESLPPILQGKLLQYIETGSFQRHGGTSIISADARIIAISTSDIKTLAQEGRFKKDLYYKLNTVPVHMLPLRERSSDIPTLARRYLSRCNSKYSERKIIPSSSMAVLMSHDWPGNLLELSQVIESSYILSDGHMITPGTIHNLLHSHDRNQDGSRVICTDIIPLKEAKSQLEEQLVKRAVEVYGTTYKAAEVLNVDQSTVSKIMKKYK